jgi:hypothetical protein
VRPRSPRHRALIRRPTHSGVPPLRFIAPVEPLVGRVSSAQPAQRGTTGARGLRWVNRGRRRRPSAPGCAGARCGGVGGGRDEAAAGVRHAAGEPTPDGDPAAHRSFRHPRLRSQRGRRPEDPAAVGSTPADLGEQHRRQPDRQGVRAAAADVRPPDPAPAGSPVRPPGDEARRSCRTPAEPAARRSAAPRVGAAGRRGRARSAGRRRSRRGRPSARTAGDRRARQAGQPPDGVEARLS